MEGFEDGVGALDGAEEVGGVGFLDVGGWQGGAHRGICGLGDGEILCWTKDRSVSSMSGQNVPSPAERKEIGL